MTGTVDIFADLLSRIGSDVTFHREEGGVACPCRTPEGFRDPKWHRANPTEPICNEQGFLTNPTEFLVKAQVQPPRMRGNRGAQRPDVLLGEVRKDDRIGFFPCEWNGNVLNFDDWSDAGEDFILYDGKRYLAVAAEKLADIDGGTSHHWEVGLRRIKDARAGL